MTLGAAPLLLFGLLAVSEARAAESPVELDYARWVRAHSLRDAGIGVTIAGATLTVASVPLFVAIAKLATDDVGMCIAATLIGASCPGPRRGSRALAGSWLATSTLGTVMAVSGPILWSVGAGRMHRFYPYDVEVRLTPTGSGLTLSGRF